MIGAPSAMHAPVDHSNFYKAQELDTILCVEVGSSRIKAARLPIHITKESLKSLETIQVPSQPWLNKNIEKLFEVSEGNPLNELLLERVSSISISIFGPLYNNGEHHYRNDIVPQNIVQHLSDSTQAKVSVEVDSVAWAIGAIEYLRLDSKTLEYPALVVTLGTSVGMALIESESSMKSIEYGWTGCPFTRVKALNERIFVLNMAYLNEISGGDIEGKMQTYRETYNRDLQALILDMSEHLETKYGVAPIKSVLVGGGFSRFIDPLDGIPQNSFLFNPQYLEKENISPDIIQLLGCLRKSQEPALSSETIPDLETLIAGIKAKAKQ